MKPGNRRMLDSPKLAWSPSRPITAPRCLFQNQPRRPVSWECPSNRGPPRSCERETGAGTGPRLPEKQGSLVGFFCPHSGTYPAPPSSPRHTLERHLTEKGQSGVLSQADLRSSPSSAALSLSLVTTVWDEELCPPAPPTAGTEQLLLPHHFYHRRLRGLSLRSQPGR